MDRKGMKKNQRSKTGREMQRWVQACVGEAKKEKLEMNKI